MYSMEFNEQYDKIYRYCYLRVRHREVAEDLTQETFLRFLEHPQYHDKDKALRYLYTIAGNLCIDEYRKVKADPLPEELPEQKDRENEWLTHIALSEAVAALPEKEQELILLRYVNEVPVSVISELYHISRFALSRRLKRILSKLRDTFEKEEKAE